VALHAGLSGVKRLCQNPCACFLPLHFWKSVSQMLVSRVRAVLAACLAASLPLGAGNRAMFVGGGLCLAGLGGCCSSRVGSRRCIKAC
jgi:hypothetical protein